MHANNLIINDGTARQTIKSVAKLLPHLDREATAALIVESVNPIDSCALVVAAQKEKVLGVLDFVGKEETNNLERLLSAIDIVTQEQVVGLCGMNDEIMKQVVR
jgi:hypothetical protein